MPNGRTTEFGHGSIAVSAITSCTNTSNPSVMIAAGLLARNAVEAGIDVPPHVKTSLAPGSQVVTEYLEESGLLEDTSVLKDPAVPPAAGLSLPAILMEAGARAIRRGQTVADPILKIDEVIPNSFRLDRTHAGVSP